VRFRWLSFVLGLVLVLAAILSAWEWSEWRLDHSQDGPIRAAARRYNLEPALVKAVVWQESRFHPQARGRAGEIGLMQLMENTAQEWADSEHLEGFVHEHCLDPATNTLAGAYYLSKVLKRYRNTDNPLPYGLADYNAGRANVLKWNHGEASTNSAAFVEAIGFPGTKQYVLSVLRRYDHYRPIFLKE
jgi:soluble lytic murein transglycosylase